MKPRVETSTPANTPAPIGPYSHIAKVGDWITIGGTAGFDPVTGALAGDDVVAQTRRILESFEVMLDSAGSDLEHVVHVNVFLRDMRDFDAMNRALKRHSRRVSRSAGQATELIVRVAELEVRNDQLAIRRTQACERCAVPRFGLVS